MTTIRIVTATILLLCAVGIVIMNWSCVISSMRNRKRGIDRRHSTVSFASLVLAGLAHAVDPRPDKLWIFLVPVLDIANWQLLMLPLLWMQTRRSKSTSRRPPNS